MAPADPILKRGSLKFLVPYFRKKGVCFQFPLSVSYLRMPDLQKNMIQVPETHRVDVFNLIDNSTLINEHHADARSRGDLKTFVIHTTYNNIDFSNQVFSIGKCPYYQSR